LNKFDRVSPKIKLGINPNAGLPAAVNLTRALKLDVRMVPGEYHYMTMDDDKVRTRRSSLPEIMTTGIGPTKAHNLTQYYNEAFK
jgi:hypothetical protein